MGEKIVIVTGEGLKIHLYEIAHELLHHAENCLVGCTTGELSGCRYSAQE
jgi:hypothetical protein